MKRTAIILSTLLLAGCGSSLREFPLRDPVTRDPDLALVSQPQPAEYVSPISWDVADQTVMFRSSRALAVEIRGEAVNANALDEVADSAWFTNRIGTQAPDDMARGACELEDVLDVEGPDGSFLIDYGKDNGASVGFRVRTNGKKYLFKAENLHQPEQVTASSTVGAALFRAAGFNVACEQVVIFRRSLLKLSPGLTVTDNTGLTRNLDDAELDRSLKSTIHTADGKLRMQASRWLSGKPIGPFRYEGTRSDDVLDVIPHENRRELRGARVLSAWLNHWDAREQNTMDVWVTKDGKGHVVHHFLDFSDCLGGAWGIDAMTPRLGYSHYFDLEHIGTDLLTFGAVERPWDRLEKGPYYANFGYFSGKDFDPDAWHDGYPNPAFARATERDNAWMARIIARFTDERVRAIVHSAKLPADHETFIADTLIARRDIILRRYLSKASPLADVRFEKGNVCATDLSRAVSSKQSYTATLDGSALPVSSNGERVCMPFPAHGPRYNVLHVSNGFAKGELLVHVIRAPNGPVLVGLERPL